MNQFMNQGMVRFDPSIDDPLKKAKLKYKMLSATQADP